MFSSLCVIPAVFRCYSQLPACCSWWMFDRFAVTSCRRSSIPPTAWASERSLTFTPAQDCSARPTLMPVSSLLSWVIVGWVTASRISNPPVCIFMLRYFVCLFETEQHFTDVMVGEEFMALSLQQVCSLISSDKLTVSTEERVTHCPVHLLSFCIF